MSSFLPQVHSAIYFQEIYQKLPHPLTITTFQIKAWYHTFYNKILESYNDKNFLRLASLLDSDKLYIQHFAYPQTEEGDFFLVNFVQLLYKIFTIYPVKYFKIQISAGGFLNAILSINKEISGLKLEWKPFYKVFKFFSYDKDLKFISNPTSSANRFGTTLLVLKVAISRYFSYEDESKTNTIDQLLKKFIPHSAIQNSITSYLTDFDSFLPPRKGEYKKIIDYFLIILKDPKSGFNCSVLNAINKIIMCNIEDDFSFLIPILCQLISDQLLVNKSLEIVHLCQILASLFISPPTREKVFNLLDSFFISIKNDLHPSVNSKGFSNYFSINLVLPLCKALKKITSKNKIYFNLNEKHHPSKEEIHRILSILSEMILININNFPSDTYILDLIKIDPLLIDRFLDSALQNIDLIDANNIANSGWITLAALIESIDSNEKVRNQFEFIFEKATMNLHNIWLSKNISSFLSMALAKIPFNKKTTIKGLENTNFCKLANSYFSNLIAFLHSIPSIRNEPAKLDKDFESSSYFCVDEMLKNSENEVFEELLPIFTSLVNDRDIFHCPYIVGYIVSKFCYYSTNEQALKIINSFRKELEFSTSNINIFRYFSSVVSTAFAPTMMTKEGIKQTVDILLPYTKIENIEIRKTAWLSIYYSFHIFNIISNAKVSIKSDKMKEYPLENARIDDFDIEFSPIPDLSDLEFDVFASIFDKLFEMKDPYEINSYLNEVGNALALTIQNNFFFTEGLQDQINEVFNNSISFIPELIKKSVSIKDNFYKCLIRIINDFSKNDNLIINVIQLINTIFSYEPILNASLISNYFHTFDHSKKKYNSELIYNLLIDMINQRKKFLIQPLSENLKKLIESIIQLTISNSKNIQQVSFNFLTKIISYYKPYISSIFEEIIQKKESISMKTFISLLNFFDKAEIVLSNDQLFCEIIVFLLKNFESNEKDIEFLIGFKKFMTSLLSSIPFEVPSDENKEYINILNEIEANYINRSNLSRNFNNFILDAIIICLKHVININDNIFHFIIKSFAYFGSRSIQKALICVSIVLKRRTKFTKERIEIKEFPTISSIPNIFDNITIKYQPNSYFFPLHLKEDTENTGVNEEILNVFESFKNVEIEWKMTEKERILYDNEFFSDSSNGFFMFKDHYYHKKYEFCENKILLEVIRDIFEFSLNSIDESEYTQCISYSYFWSYIALTVGPFSIPILAEITRKYFSEYFKSRPEVISMIIYDMILGFLEHINYWEIEYRNKFFKLIVLPSLCIISVSSYIPLLFKSLLKSSCNKMCPFSIAPLIKIVFDLYQQGPYAPLYNRYFARNIANVMCKYKMFFFNSMDQIIAKFIVPFVDKMSEYKIDDIKDIVFLFFRLFDCCSYYDKISPLYSDAAESKKIEISSIFDKIFHKENTNDCLIYFLLFSFINFEEANVNARLFVAPIFVKNLQIIFQLLKSSRISNEESFFQSFKEFIENDIFFLNNKLQLDFISSLIHELMYSPLPLQIELLENLNRMLENNIFNIQMNEYHIYEDLIIKYGMHANEMNFGNDLRLKIAKILGIFEIRKNSMKKLDGSIEKLDDDIVILKAASIILNTYLINNVDTIVIDALDTLEGLCNKKSINKEFFKSVLKIFFKRHSGNVTNDVENILIQYNCMLSPSYIC